MREEPLMKLYYNLPIWLQNLAFSLHGFKLKRQRYNKKFYKYIEFLKESEFWDKERIRQYQNDKVRYIVKHAYETVPFYKKWYDEYNVDITKIKTVEDLKYLPILKKEMVRENNDQFLSSKINKSKTIIVKTSGTTGTPLRIYFTKEALALQWAIWWRHKARFGIHIGDRHLVFGARVPISQKQNKPPFWREDFVNNRVYLSSYHISKKNLKSIVDYLNSTYFDFYTGYPSSIYLLANLMEEYGYRLYNRPKYIVTGSEVLTDKYYDQIKRTFGVTITEQYGMNEFAGNLSKCEYGNYHLDFECCTLELESLDYNGYKKLIFTGWGNEAMPFIRYDIGDYGIPFQGKCKCGRESIALSRIDGRLEDYILTPDGRKIMGMNQVFKYAENAKLIQIFQKNVNLVEIRVVPGKYFNRKDENALKKAFLERVGKGMNVNIVKVKNIELTNSGKFKAVISELK